MAVFIQLARFIFGIGLLGVVQMVVSFVLPWPMSSVHIILLGLVMILFLYEHGSIIWLAAALFVLLDFSSLYPFGLSLLAGTSATVIMLLMYRGIFTNRSLFAAMGLFAIGYVVYRIWYIAFELGAFLFFHATLDLGFHMRVYGTQLITTTLVLMLVYSVVSKFSFQLQHTQIQESWFRTLRSK